MAFLLAILTVANVLVDKVIFRFGSMKQLLSDRGNTNSRHLDWDIYLDVVLFAYNTSVSTGIGFTLFFLMHEYEAKLPVDHNLLKQPKETIEIHDFMGDVEEKTYSS